MKNLWKVLKYGNNYKMHIVLNVVFNLLAVIFSLFSLSMLIPFLDLIFLKTDAEHLANIVGTVPVFEFSIEAFKNYFYYHFSSFIIEDPENGKMKALVYICLAIMLFVFLKNLFRYLALHSLAEMRNGILRDLRNSLYRKILALPLSYYSNEKKGDIIARMSSDVQEIEWTILRSVEMIFRDPASIIIFLIAMVLMSAKLTLFVFILLPLTGLLIGKVGKSLRKTSKEGQAKMGLIMTMIDETLGGLRIIKAFNAEHFSSEKFSKLNNDYKQLMVKMYRKRDLSSPMSEFLGVAVLVLLIWFGGKLVLSNANGLSASVFIAYIAIFSQIIEPAKSFTTAYYNLQKGAASADRVEEILQADESIKNPANPKEIKSFTNEIEFKNVSFSYQKELVLNNISFKIKKGQTIALVGPSGGGKSTLADLIPRFHDPIKGQVCIDGIDIREFDIKDLRALMGIVTQHSILFNDSIFCNIAFGNENAELSKVQNAAEIANAHEFISKMPQQYLSNIGDGGSKLSGGQRQRLSIARAVFKNPPILILDEATSALDTESEKQVQDALANLMQNRTSLVIAHRLSTIKSADLILVIDKGNIAEQGTHNELINNNGLYAKLHDLQTFN
jgi:subfamily B ATP-binding cassette protein MsbA